MEIQSQVSPIAVEDEERTTRSATFLITGIIVFILGTVIYLSTTKIAKDWSTNSEKYWSNISALVTTSATIAGVWFVWLKFIRARNFAQKVEISLSPTRILLEKNSSNLHAIDIKIENKGSSSITNYSLEPELYIHKDSINSIPNERVTSHLFGNKSRKILRLDVGACSFAHYVVQIDGDKADAITFGIKMKNNNDKVEWENFITISNALKPEKSSDGATSSIQSSENS
jgi:hypothetical protein